MKFGVDQTDSPEPRWMKNLFNLVVIAIAPAFAIWIISVPENILNLEYKNFIGATSTFFVAIFQAIKELSGDGSISIRNGLKRERTVNIILIIVIILLVIAVIFK